MGERDHRRRTTRALPERMPSWGVLLLESHHAPGFVMEWRRHPFVKIVYALEGAGYLRAERSRIAFESRDLLVVPPRCRNRLLDTPGRPASLYVLGVARSLLRFDPTLEGRLRLGRLRESRLADRAEMLLRRLRYQQTAGDADTPLAMVRGALELIELVVEPASTVASSVLVDGTGARPRSAGGDRAADDELARYVRRLDTHFYEATSLDHAAAQLGVSRRTFSQRFRERTGKPWLAYVRGRAIDHAQKLLAETPEPIATIAFECGFNDLSGFYRAFKAETGVAPGKWRRDAQPFGDGGLA